MDGILNEPITTIEDMMYKYPYKDDDNESSLTVNPTKETFIDIDSDETLLWQSPIMDTILYESLYEYFINYFYSSIKVINTFRHYIILFQFIILIIILILRYY